MTVTIERIGMPLDEFLATFDQNGGYDLIDGERIPLRD